MDKGGGDMGPTAANNSSDFVRKLYRMLEDPNYNNIVRWSENGDSFVVLEGEKFTKDILPKHFKHSNFASFVRQLNKYDFHKIRQSNEDNTLSQYPPGTWEFKHPDFQMDKKDSLDNIRRKAPAPRKRARSPDDQESGHSQQLNYVSNQLSATQQQLQQLQHQYQDLYQGHKIVIEQFVQLQRFVKNHDGVIHQVMGFLRGVDAQRRSSRVPGPFGNHLMNGELPNGALVDDQPASPLQHASELLNNYPVETLSTKQLEQMTNEYHSRDEFQTPPNDPSASTMESNSATGRSHLGPFGAGDLESLVYPVGHTNGIDPINSEHINNIPYGLPPNNLPINHMQDSLTEGTSTTEPMNTSQEAVFGSVKPRILLVEDDKICAKIGAKFLQAFECGVEIARDGLEAVNKMNAGARNFDLILMDIIMPHLDGISATACIRDIRTDIPIIAMTSNIRTDDIDMYFKYGMNDVLPKPFTKEGMLRALEKHLPKLRKGYKPEVQMAHPGSFTAPNAQHPGIGMGMAPISAIPPVKEEPSPGKSPATMGSWDSPRQMPGQMPGPMGNVVPSHMPGPLPGQMVGQMPSPIHTSGSYMQQGHLGDGRQYTMTPTHSHTGFPPPPPPPISSNMQGSLAPRPGMHRRGISDMTGGPDDRDSKRQRAYPPQQNQFP